MSKPGEFSGVYPMLFALFDAEGKLSRDAMRIQVNAVRRHRPHGVGILGLASEVNKLTSLERRSLLEWVAEDLAGELPLSVTIAGPSVAAQVEFVKAAKELGGQWVILQPPPVVGVAEGELVRFFGAVADASEIPVAIQIAPQYLGSGLSLEGLATLNRNHSNVSILKLEASALSLARLADATEGRFTLFNGCAGAQMVECIRAGAAGVIPGGESYDKLARIYEKVTSGDPAEERVGVEEYRAILPLLMMLAETIDTFLSHAKPLLCRRLSIENDHVRPPSQEPTSFGQEVIREYAARLGAL